jgi:hypothetical protein
MQCFKRCIFPLSHGNQKLRAVEKEYSIKIGFSTTEKKQVDEIPVKDSLLVIKVKRNNRIHLEIFLLIHSTKQRKNNLIWLSHLTKPMQKKLKRH